MNINDKVNFTVEERSSKEGKTYYAVFLHIGEVEKVLCFLTKDQYSLISK